MLAKEAYEIIKEGALIVLIDPSKGARERTHRGYSTWTNHVSFPKDGAIVREVRPKYQYGEISGYEVLFEGKPDNYFVTHSQIDFNASKLEGVSRVDLYERKISQIAKSIEKHNDTIAEAQRKIEAANSNIAELKAKIELLNELGDDSLDETTLEAYAVVKVLRRDNLSDLDAAKEIAKLLK